MSILFIGFCISINGNKNCRLQYFLQLCCCNRRHLFAIVCMNVVNVSHLYISFWRGRFFCLFWKIIFFLFSSLQYLSHRYQIWQKGKTYRNLPVNQNEKNAQNKQNMHFDGVAIINKTTVYCHKNALHIVHGKHFTIPFAAPWHGTDTKKNVIRIKNIRKILLLLFLFRFVHSNHVSVWLPKPVTIFRIYWN